MKLQIDELGFVGVNVEDWNINRSYRKPTITTDYNAGITYITRKNVPAGIPLTDNEYWKPIVRGNGFTPTPGVIDSIPTKDSPNAVSSGGTFGALQQLNEINTTRSEDGKIYNNFFAGDIYYTEQDTDVRVYWVAFADGEASEENPVTINAINFYRAENAVDAVRMSLSIRTVSTKQQQKLTPTQQVNAQNNIMAKAYDAAAFSGLGKKVLAKNMQEVGGEQKNVLTQAMFDESNTVYDIQYDFVTNEPITIPAGSVLNFNGGSIGENVQTLTLNKTELIGDVKILCDVAGTVANSSIDITWLGCTPSLDTSALPADCSARLQQAVDLARRSHADVFVPAGIFRIDNTVYIKRGTNFVGEHGHTFTFKSQFTTSIQTDDFVMFKGKNDNGTVEAIRHCQFSGITFSRKRTAAESAGGLGGGDGYGLAGTVFHTFTELRLLNCGFIGFGRAMYNGSIAFCDNTDFAYCNTIIESPDQSGTNASSCIVVSHANIWCCGDLLKSNYYGMCDVVISNSWIEYANSIYTGLAEVKMQNIVLDNVWFTNSGYTSPHLINVTGSVGDNTPSFFFKNCWIKNKGQICNYQNAATTVKVTFTDCFIIYGGDYSLETCQIYGNSELRNYSNEYSLVGFASNRGIDTASGLVSQGLTFAQMPNKNTRGNYAIFRGNDNILQYFDSAQNRAMMMHAYWVTGDVADIPNAQQSIYLLINTAPTNGADVLQIYNKVTGQHFTLKDSNPIYGTTAQRPTRMINGACYFDKDLGKPIWVMRDANSVPHWVDANGNNVDVQTT